MLNRFRYMKYFEFQKLNGILLSTHLLKNKLHIFGI